MTRTTPLPERIAIIGSPRAGKTTLGVRMAVDLRLPLLSSDALINLGWHEASSEVARQLKRGPGIFEGVAVVRALRKLLIELPPPARPCELCIVLTEPRVVLTQGQDAMRKACATVLRQIEPELVNRGVVIEVNPLVPVQQ